MARARWIATVGSYAENVGLLDREVAIQSDLVASRCPVTARANASTSFAAGLLPNGSASSGRGALVVHGQNDNPVSSLARTKRRRQ
jgi:hypothetical protein